MKDLQKTVGRVLIVDDQRPNRELLAGLVAQEGHEIVTACGGAAALEILEREHVDLMLLDLAMPGIDGFEVLARLGAQGRLPSLPVVVVTAHDDKKHRQEALEAGAIELLTKPVDRIELTCKVRNLIELHALRKTAAREAAQDATASLLSEFDRAAGGLPLFLFGGATNQEGVFVTTWVAGNVEGMSGIPRERYVGSDAWFRRILALCPGRRGLILQSGPAGDAERPRFLDAWHRAQDEIFG